MITVTYLDHMGDDLSVVNAARVSFAKHSEFVEFAAGGQALSPADERLVYFLARNGHWTPFAHPQISVHVRAPVFVRTQCFKHKVGFVENEVSRRYVDDPPEFYLPSCWRGRAADKKQGSSNVEVAMIKIGADEHGEHFATPDLLAEDLFRTARETYDALIGGGVAPEQARMVLPQAMLTEWIWTGSLAAFARFAHLRDAPDAQAETAEVARQCGELIGELFPTCWTALRRAQEGESRRRHG